METGEIYFTTNPSGALIYLDDILIVDPETEEPARTPKKIKIYYGEHDFVLRLEGFCDETGHLYVFPGTSVTINRNFKECPTMKKIYQDKTGDVILTTYPEGAKIYLDNMLIIDEETKEPIKTPVTLAISPGFHYLRFQLEGYCDEFDSVYVFSSSRVNINKNLNIC